MRPSRIADAFARNGKRAALTSVVGQHLDAHRRVPFGRRLHHLSGSVGASVVDEDHLMVEVLAGEIVLDLLDGAREP